ARRPLTRGARPCREECDVEALDRLVAQRLDDRAVELAARGPLGRERDHLAHGEGALAQLGPHDGAYGARGAHDRDPVAHTRALPLRVRSSAPPTSVDPGPAGDADAPNGCSASTWSVPSSNALCSARTARSTSVALTTQEI